jgi:RNA polymerase sigma-70 factor (ECF subfamily)
MMTEKNLTTIKQIREKILPIAFRQTSSKEDAEDAVQEVLIRLWHHRTEWDKYENLEAVAVRTLKNLFIDQYRKKQSFFENLENIELPEYEPDVLKKLELKDEVKQILKIMDELPPLQSKIVMMKDVEDYETEEIALITQSSIEAVRMNLSRARKAIREKMKKNNP